LETLSNRPFRNIIQAFPTNLPTKPVTYSTTPLQLKQAVDKLKTTSMQQRYNLAILAFHG
jgi:mannosyltransferase OCH1-like enzyme